MMAKPTTLSPAQLRAFGYCRVSRKYRYASRIDRADWLQVLRKARLTIARLTLSGLADQYRRVYSKDVVEVATLEDLLQLDNGNGANFAGVTQYVPKDGDPQPEDPRLPQRLADAMALLCGES